MSTVQINGKPYAGEIGETLSAFLLRHGLVLPHPCGQKGTCLACRIHAVGKLSPPTHKELLAFSPDQLADGSRLACQTRILGDAAVFLPSLQGAAVDWQSEIVYPPIQKEGLGLAVDIGTTTCALALVDQNSGSVLGQAAVFNPQSLFGQDVLSRISHTDTHREDLPRMQTLLTDAIENAAIALCRQAKAECGQINRLVCVGNTVMLHYLVGIDPSPIGRFPFTPPTLFDREYPASALSFSRLSAANIYFPPCIGGYIGADVTAGLLLLPRQSTPYLFADVGTNGEIAAYSPQDGYIFTSAAAGPAFEGGGISCGSSASVGAVTSAVRRDGAWHLSVLGNGSPRSICGSGLIDIAATLLNEGRLSSEGRLIQRGDKADPISLLNGEAVCTLSDTLFLTQQDIYQLLLAKAAIAAALDNIHTHRPSDTLYIGGGFGSYVDLTSAKRIGLFGSHAYKTVRPMGNTALGGAVTLLTSPIAKESFSDICRQPRLVDCGGNKDFEALFIEHLLFPTERT